MSRPKKEVEAKEPQVPTTCETCSHAIDLNRVYLMCGFKFPSWLSAPVPQTVNRDYLCSLYKPKG
ncbi:hypothetical protein UFOVP63_8 [uncultured Caudovirales phage]|uniref:Uncharacterized protein n=1 Tax=uncultured Caudovirales phage TaxID=2100421 RepID=A0A6J5KUC5_9CAUD|nr:hypothetical protein UFOVP63_8 [uncultured Caudovirales phage]